MSRVMAYIVEVEGLGDPGPLDGAAAHDVGDEEWVVDEAAEREHGGGDERQARRQQRDGGELGCQEGEHELLEGLREAHQVVVAGTHGHIPRRGRHSGRGGRCGGVAAISEGRRSSLSGCGGARAIGAGT